MTQPTLPTSPKQPCQRDDALAVLKRLRDAGHLAYFAGGCVRDELMGLQPKDYDVATDAPPQRVQELFTNTQAVGAAFGVILVRHRRSVVEVATFRTDVSYEDGRRPTAVRFTTAEEDARRRDFTINGLFLDPLENRVIDYVGGQEDIRSRVVRAIGEPSHRFDEDHLRLLRAVRFASRFAFGIDTQTADAIRAHADKLARVSPERIADELRMMLTRPTRGAAWAMLWEFGLTSTMFRFVPEPAAATLDKRRSIVLALDPPAPKAFGLVLAAAALCFRWQSAGFGDLRRFLQRDEVVRSVRAMRQALRISNEEAHEMSQVLETIAPLLADAPPTLAIKKRFLAESYWPGALNLMEAIASIGERAERILPMYVELMQLSATDHSPPPLVTGDDLVARGLKPGPAFKRALDFVYDEQLEGRVTTREHALELGERKVREFEAEKPAR